MKRIIIFSIICILFIILGTIQIDNFSFLYLLVLPFDLLGSLLRTMSLDSMYLNILAILFFIGLTSSPLILLGYRLNKKKAHMFEIVLLPILVISLGITLYYFTNPHILYNSLSQIVREITPMENIKDLELILTSGVAYIFYALLIIYLVSLAFVNNKFDSMKYFKGLVDSIIIIYAFALLSIGLSTLITDFKATTITAERTTLILEFIGSLAITCLSIYILDIFKKVIILVEQDGFQESLLETVKKLYTMSFILLLVTISTQAFINIYQFIKIDELMNIQFAFDLPIVTILIVSIVFILTRYITKVIELKEDHELII